MRLAVEFSLFYANESKCTCSEQKDSIICDVLGTKLTCAVRQVALSYFWSPVRGTAVSSTNGRRSLFHASSVKAIKCKVCPDSYNLPLWI